MIFRVAVAMTVVNAFPSVKEITELDTNHSSAWSLNFNGDKVRLQIPHIQGEKFTAIWASHVPCSECGRKCYGHELNDCRKCATCRLKFSAAYKPLPDLWKDLREFCFEDLSYNEYCPLPSRPPLMPSLSKRKRSSCQR